MHDEDTYLQIAELHVAEINQGFLATLGVDFLALLYRAIDDSNESILLVERDKGRVIGFVSGAGAMAPIYWRMLRHWPKLAKSLLPSLFRPNRVWRILEILHYSRKHGSNAHLPAFELLSIAVRRDDRGRGIAQSLYNALIDEFRTLRVGEFRIVVGDELDAAHRFYKRMGAVPVERTEVHRGRGSTIYVQVLS